MKELIAKIDKLIKAAKAEQTANGKAFSKATEVEALFNSFNKGADLISRIAVLEEVKKIIVDESKKVVK